MPTIAGQWFRPEQPVLSTRFHSCLRADCLRGCSIVYLHLSHHVSSMEVVRAEDRHCSKLNLGS
jgi:hypothetical protein